MEGPPWTPGSRGAPLSPRVADCEVCGVEALSGTQTGSPWTLKAHCGCISSHPPAGDVSQCHGLYVTAQRGHPTCQGHTAGQGQSRKRDSGLLMRPCSAPPPGTAGPGATCWHPEAWVQVRPGDPGSCQLASQEIRFALQIGGSAGTSIDALPGKMGLRA